MVLLIAFIVMLFGQKADLWIRQRYFCTPVSEFNRQVMVSNLQPYFDSLKPEASYYWLREELARQQSLGITLMSESNYQELERASNRSSTRQDTKMIQSIHNYDMLSNPIYVDKF